MKIILGERIVKGNMVDYPYDYGIIENAIPTEKKMQLRKEFPKDNFHISERKMGHDKTYKHCGRHLIVPGENKAWKSEKLTQTWKDLVSDLLSDEYRKAIEKLTGQDLSEHVIGADLWRFEPGDGCFISPHADVDWKTVSHISYFVDEWQEEWGGMLGIHDINKENDCVKMVKPTLGKSAVLIRSDKSFHSIHEVKSNAQESRKVLDVVFFNKIPPTPRPGRIESDIISENELYD